MPQLSRLMRNRLVKAAQAGIESANILSFTEATRESGELAHRPGRYWNA